MSDFRFAMQPIVSEENGEPTGRSRITYGDSTGGIFMFCIDNPEPGATELTGQVQFPVMTQSTTFAGTLDDLRRICRHQVNASQIRNMLAQDKRFDHWT
jgi:hypothetical protein